MGSVGGRGVPKERKLSKNGHRNRFTRRCEFSKMKNNFIEDREPHEVWEEGVGRK